MKRLLTFISIILLIALALPHIVKADSSPVITMQPTSMEAEVGEIALFTVQAAGEGTLSYQWQSRKNASSTWNNSGQNGAMTNTLSVNALAGLDGWQFQCIITDAVGNKTTSDTAILSIALAINVEPDDQRTIAGSTVPFSTVATGKGPVSYQWQSRRDDTATWVNSGQNGAKTNTLSVATSPGLNGWQFRCVVKDGKGQTEYTRTAILSIIPNITSQPTDTRVVAGKVAEFSVEATGRGPLTYQWQSRKNDTAAWTNSGQNGAKTNTLSVATSLGLNGWQFRCIVTDTNKQKEYSNVVSVWVISDAPKIVLHPMDRTAISGNAAEFSVEAICSDEITYQWQSRKDDASAWARSAQTGSQTAMLSVETTPGLNGWQFRCVVKGSNGKMVVSDSAILTVMPVAITQQPTDTSAVAGVTADFSIEATGKAPITYQWQSRKDDTATWTNSGQNGAKTNTLSVATSPGLNGWQFRCIVTACNGSKKISDVVTLSIVPKIINEPKNVSVAAGEQATFSVEAAGKAPLKYQWQSRKNEVSAWTNSGQNGAKTNTLSVAASRGLDGWQFRCVITDVNGQKITTATVSLAILPPPSITTHPFDQVIPVGSEASFYIYANGQTPLKYQWQIKKTTDIEWQELDQNESNASTVCIVVTKDMQDCQLRCIVTDRNGVQAFSNTAIITLCYYDLPINEINFPDECFREYVRTYLDTDQNQQLSLSELRNTTYIEPYGMEISSLKGIEFFFSLTGLACKDNHIADLDISCNTKLGFLDCSNNELSSIDVSNNPTLYYFICNDNALTDLDLSENPELVYLDCYHNLLKQLDLKTNNKLTHLYHDYGTLLVDNERDNYFEHLYDVPINENTFPDTAFRQYILNNIDIDNNIILSPEEKRAVTEIIVCGLNISTLDGIQEFGNLTVLDCSNNKLIELNLPENNTLTFLDCRNNRLMELNVTVCKALKTLNCDTETIVTGWCWENVQLNTSNFPDTTFRQYLSDKYDKDKDGTLDSAELRSIKEIWFTGSKYDGIIQLNGIELFPFLETLNCSGCSITSLDVRNNKQLKKLICDGTRLRSLDVSGLSSLEYLSCGFYSNFSSLNVEGCTSLKEISCNNSTLSVLNVSTNTELEILDCQANNLSSLVLGSNSKLTQLKCDVNRLTTLNISSCKSLTNLTCNNNALKTLDLRSNSNLIQLKCEKNQLTSLEIAGLAKLEGLSCINNRLKSLDVRGTMLTTINCDSTVTINWDEEGIPIDETNFPDEIFRDYVLAIIDKNKNGLISEAERIVTTVISVPNSGISSLKGIEFLTNLESLDCSNNNLTNLYLETNTKLKILVCPQNSIVTLDLSNNTQMTNLWCWENNLSVLIMPDATELEALDCSFNSLSVIDLSDSAKINYLKCDNETIVITNQARIPINEAYFPDSSFRTFVMDNLDLDQDGTLNTAERKLVTDLYISNKGITSLRGIEYLTSLKYITCSGNDLKAINLTNNLKLKGLNCTSNELAYINVRGLTKLEYIVCSDNNLEKLDVSTNEALVYLFVDEGTTIMGANDSLEINMGN